MSPGFEFDKQVPFSAESAGSLHPELPSGPGVLCLRGERRPDGSESQPYLTRTADLRRRGLRLLAPPEAHTEDGQPVLSRRLNLRDRVRSVEWTRTGSEFESTLLLYRATRALFGPEEARRRLRLYAPYCVRVTIEHQHPRVYVTNRLSRRALPECFGPFPSRAAAERYADAVLDLFKLRRCHEDLQPHPDHPGCAYGEMKKCMEPCKAACSADEYSAEAMQVFSFLSNRGEALLADLGVRREAASEAMDFEAAAALHKQWEKVRAASLLADEVVRPLPELRCTIVQEAAPTAAGEHLEQAALFLLQHGRLVGPEILSTLGVRAVREQTAVGSSLFAQPLMLAAVPLDERGPATPSAAAGPEAAPLDGLETAPLDGLETAPLAPTSLPSPASQRSAQAAHAVALSPEDRARAAVGGLTELAVSGGQTDAAELADFLSLFRRWYYRPDKQRAGAAFLPNPDGGWPMRRVLNAAARCALGSPTQAAPVDRAAARDLKTKLLHAGREGVEREVPVLPKRKAAGVGRRSGPTRHEPVN